MAPASPTYPGRRAALLTRHGKVEDIAIELTPSVGCEVVATDAFDTDSLGTFDGRAPRREDQLATARRKATLAAELTGLSLGIGSEGAFGPDPLIGLSPWDVEVVSWLDLNRGLRVEGWAQGPAMAASGEVADARELAVLASRATFPSHGLLLRPVGGAPDSRVEAWGDAHGLAEAFERCARMSPQGRVWVESDLRAHRNPTRRGIIRQAAANLAARLVAACASCGSPGFGLIRRLPGLPCGTCGTPTHVARAELLGCPSCGREEERAIAGPEAAGEADCPCCNP